MSDIAETITKLETESVKNNPFVKTPLVILLKNMKHKIILLKDKRYTQGTQLSLDDLDSNKLYYFKFKEIGGSFNYKCNLPLQVDEIREKIERLGYNKEYYVTEIKEKNK